MLPPPSQLKTMRWRDLLRVGAEYFEAEGRRAIDLQTAAVAAYGADRVGPEMDVRAGVAFALANFLTDVRSKAEGEGVRKDDAALAARMAAMLRGALTPSVPAPAKTEGEAA